MAALPGRRRAGYYVPQENWDISILQQVNAQLEMYLKSLPAGSELSLTELQDIASRQQLQIDNQQQVLVAKEQRLKYLKQQEMKHQQMSAENERLRKLKEKVESQEMKLKKLRAVRGQVEQYKINNNNLTSELEGIKSLFNEKEKELAMAVAKVEELTTQLESLRAGKTTSINNNTSLASIELEKLRKELILRNKLNEQQSMKIVANRDMLQQRKGEIQQIDQRISDLQQRLKKKKAQNASGHNCSLNYNDNLAHSRQTAGNRNGTNIAAVEPYMKQAPKDVTKDDLHTNFGFDRQDPKNQTLPANLKFPYPEKGKGLENRSDHSTNNPNVSDAGKNYTVPLVVTVDSSKGPPNGDTGKVSPPEGIDKARVPSTSNMKYAGPGSKGGMGMANFAPKPFGSTYSTSMLTGRPFVPTASQPAANIQDEIRTGGSGQSSPATSDNSYPVSHPAQPVPSNHSQGTIPQRTDPALNSKPLYNNAKIGHVGLTQSVASARPKVTAPVPSRDTKPMPFASKNGNHGSSNAETAVPSIPPRQASASTFASSSKHPMQTPLPRPSQKVPAVQPTTSNGASSNNTATFSHSKTVPVQPSSSSSKPGPAPAEHPISGSNRWPKPAVTSASVTSHDNSNHGRIPLVNTPNTISIQNGNNSAANSGGAAPGVAQPAKGVPRYAPKSVIANTYTQKLGSGAIEQYRKNMSMLYQGFGERKPQQQQEGGSTGTGDGANADAKTTSIKPPVSGSHNVPSSADVTDSRVNSTSSLSQYASDKPSFKATSPKHLRRRHSDGSDNEEVQTRLLPTQPVETPPPPKPSTSSSVDQTANSRTAEPSSEADSAILVIDNMGNVLEMSDSADLSVTSAQSEMFGEPGEEATRPKAPIVIETNKVKHRLKTNLKEKSSSSRSSNKRVSFDPLALLLDASLEGELELVRKTASEVTDVSASNDEGITALHNAICAGHYEIVKFLVEFGADANAPDSDGWTPLHCAASCNNLPMVKLLVDHGACIFATTISDQETAAEKCEEDEDGYDGCSEYLYSIQEKLGIINNGVVYAVFDYKSQNSDELSFRVNSMMTILRKGDEKEKEWWWARIRDREGYVPRNLLGLSRRVLGDKGKIQKT